MPPPLQLTLHVDGGARGNPGPAGAGVVLSETGGALIHEAGYYLGEQTNNVAEYTALIRGLERAQRLGQHDLTIFSDSELLVRQVTGAYQVRKPHLVALFEHVQLLLLKVGRWSVRHIRREENRRADELANLAMDRRADVVVFDVDPAVRAEVESAGGSGASPPSAGPGAAPPAPAPGKQAAARSDSSGARGSPQGAARGRCVRVELVSPPRAGACPAPCFSGTTWEIGASTPAGLCVHAAGALLPTVLAMLNTDQGEFAGVPTMTIRCPRAGCMATFQLSAMGGGNGVD
ncbi:MAG: ribonuclease HI family protein [Phycisphaerales bacterium]|nr:ribonuclease HI family protein [Phycisphaerales bacterium]